MEHTTFLNKTHVFNTVYEQHWKALYAFAFNILRNKESAEDILQDIFIDFWSRMEETQIQNHTAYLFQAVRNQCAKKLRGMKLTEFEIGILEESIQSVEEEELADLTDKVLAEEIRKKASEILPKKCLEIFALRFYENKSIQDIASLKEISSSTVENQINKALKLLKKDHNYSLKLLAVLILCS